MKMVLGGIMTPKVPAAAMLPQARPGSYPCRRISGMATLPMAAAVALVEPQMAEKPAVATTVAKANPPRRRPNSVYAPSYSLPLIPA